MAADNGLDDVQTQAPAIPILGAALIGFVEAVKYQGQLFGGNGFTIVGHGNVGLAAAFGDAQPQSAAIGAEFHRIVGEIV